MSKTEFYFQSLDVRYIPGLPTGLPLYDNIHPRINIIAGPNASGKSSTARTLQGLIWPDRETPLHAVAQVLVGEQYWKIRKNHQQVSIQHDGKEKQMPRRPPAEERHRYLLALHELIRVDNQDLAQLIIQESAGGYNLDQAGKDLQLSDHIYNRGTKAYQNYRQAEQEYRKTYRQQSSLEQDRRQLESIKERKKQAEQADSLKTLYDIYLSYRDALNEREQLEKQIETYPEGLDRAEGNEAQLLRDVTDSIRELQIDNESRQDSLDRLRDEKDSIELPEGGIADQKLDLLDNLVEQMQSVADKVQDKKARLEEERESADASLKAIDLLGDKEKLEKLSLDSLADMEEWLHQTYSVLGREQLKRRQLEELEREEDPNLNPPETIKIGINELLRWLYSNAGSPNRKLRGWILFLTVGWGVAVSLAAYFWGEPALWGLTGFVLIILYWYYQNPTQNDKTNLQQHVDHYKSTNLPMPESWEPEPVIETMNKLADEWAKSQFEQRREQSIERLKLEIKEIENNELKEIRRQQEQWKKKMGAAPDLLEEGKEGYTRFYWFIRRINEWHQSRVQMDSFQAGIAQLQKELNEHIKDFQENLDEIKETPPETPEQARSLVNELRRRERKRQEITQKIENQNQQRKQNQNEINRLEQQAQTIFSKFGLDTADIGEIERRLQMLDDYRDIKKRCNEAGFKVNQKESQLKDHPLYKEHIEELEKQNRDQLKAKRNDLQQEAENIDTLREQIHQIETKVREAQKRHDLERALVKKDEALEGLTELYENNLSSLTGNLVLEKIKQITKYENQPAVLREASKLLNRITGGRYELQVDEEHTRFRAYDTVTDTGQPLDQLSTGTRIQLLLSVRLAFIESREQSMRLPILADELLANSDEQRANAIIRALVQMSREGRQIFYFTAQADEVYKWKSYLEEQQLGYRLYEIGTDTGRGFAYFDSYRPPKEAMQMLEKVPEPEDRMSHSDYGEQLDIPPFQIMVEPVSAMHLWYLIEDLEVLHACLSRRIRRWGELQSYMEHGGKIYGLEGEKWRRIAERADLLIHFQELYRRGRPYPIDRRLIEETDAVTENFQEAVAEKLNELEGDPQKLLDALREGEIRRFQKAKIDELESYLREQNYISDEKPLTVDEIRTRLQAYLDQLNISKTDANRLIERVI